MKTSANKALASAMHYFLTACCILAVFASPSQVPLLPPAHDRGGTQTATREDMLEAYAVEICAIGFTARDPSVLVNAFGPISYSESKGLKGAQKETNEALEGARFIRDESVRLGVLGNLTGCKRVIGWPVSRLMNDLKARWAAS